MIRKAAAPSSWECRASSGSARPPTWLRSSRSWVSDEARGITGDIVAVDGGSKL